MLVPVSASRVPLNPYRFTIRDYLRMGEAGILRPEDRVELTQGQVVSMSPTGNWHSAAVERLSRLLHDQIREPLRVVVQNAINIGEDTQLLPDLAVVGPQRSTWEMGFRGQDCLLVIEVAQSSLATDRTTKKAIYAAEGIQEYWIVDLEGRAVEVYCDPQDGDYRSRTIHPGGEVIASVSVAEVSVPVVEITPPVEEG